MHPPKEAPTPVSVYTANGCPVCHRQQEHKKDRYCQGRRGQARHERKRLVPIRYEVYDRPPK